MTGLRKALPKHGGGLHAILYTLAMARRVGPWRLWKAMTSRNACKTCALGMGGQKGGMRNELGHWPEVCKKSLQAMAADMQGALAPEFFQTFGLRQLQALSPRELETAGRLVDPVIAAVGATHYAKIGWERALDEVAAALKAADPQTSFFYFSGRSSNEAGFLLQLLARLYGTNHVNNCSYYCHQASGVGLGQAIGSGTATIDLNDVEHADLFFLIGGNPASNHPRLMTQLMKIRRRGGVVISVNPVNETGLKKFRVPSDPRSLLFGTEVASHFAQINIGGDIAFMAGLAKALRTIPGAVDAAYIAQSTEHYAAVEAVLETLSWDDVERESGLTRARIEELAAIYAKAKRAVFGWTMGITHHDHGVENVQWITNLALMRGMVGKPHAGLLPIRGHSNVQGLGTMGVMPAMKDAILKRFAAEGIPLPTHKGFDTMECMEAAHAGRMRVAVCLGGNLFGSNPDATYAREALSKVDLVVYLSTALNTGHAHGLGKRTLILPVLARDEEPYVTTQESMFNFVRVSDGGRVRHAGPRGEVEIAAALGARLFAERNPGGIDWATLRDADAVRAWIARLIPGMEAAKDAGRTKTEFTIPGRVLHEGKFPTPSGKARFFGHSLPVRAGGGLRAETFALMTIRSEGQFNTVVYEDHDYYRGQERRDIVLMSPEDMQRLGWHEDDIVTVANATGRMSVRARAFDVKPGNVAMYCPEANVLVPRRLDPQSRTPAFKAVAVTIERTGRADAGGAGGMPSVATQLWRRAVRPKLKSC